MRPVFRCPITVRGHRFDAIIDPGCVTTIFSTQAANLAHITTVPYDGPRLTIADNKQLSIAGMADISFQLGSEPATFDTRSCRTRYSACATSTPDTWEPLEHSHACTPSTTGDAWARTASSGSRAASTVSAAS